jgi:hypothetical protein
LSSLPTAAAAQVVQIIKQKNIKTPADIKQEKYDTEMFH